MTEKVKDIVSIIEKKIPVIEANNFEVRPWGKLKYHD